MPSREHRSNPSGFWTASSVSHFPAHHTDVGVNRHTPRENKHTRRQPRGRGVKGTEGRAFWSGWRERGWSMMERKGRTGRFKRNRGRRQRGERG